MAAHTHNPVTVVLRVAGLAAVGLVVYGFCRLTITIWNDVPQRWWGIGMWEMAGYMMFCACWAALLGVGLLLAWTAIRRPGRSHLALLVGVSVFVGCVWLMARLTQLLETVLRPAAFQSIEGPLQVWGVLAVSLVLAVPLEWWLAKRARFVEAERRWWSAGNIRGMCVLLAWLMFFALSSLPFNLQGIVVEPYRREAEGILWLVLIAGCIAFAKLAPVLLMRLTGVPEESAPERARRRGFRLY